MSTDFVAESIPRPDASEEAQMAVRFPRDVATHAMIPSRDDGVYRHLRFRRFTSPREGGRPRTSSLYWFDLITWPGHLTITGDCGTYTFARSEDMFGFFRGSAWRGQINPGYWAEKVRGEVRLKRYSSVRFREFVMADLREGEEEFPGLTATAEKEIFDGLGGWNTEYEDGAREALRDFGFGDTFTASCRCGAKTEGLPSWGDAEAWRTSHRLANPDRAAHVTATGRTEGFRFYDTCEWDLGDWDWQFLWCCHAIVFGIAMYDRSKAVAR